MKPRGLMIIHHFRPGQVGGAELQAEHLAAQMVKLGHDMHVLTWLTVPGAPHDETSEGVQIHRTTYPLPYWITFGAANTFRYLVQHRRDYDILHAHQAFGHAVVAVVIARCFRKKAIIKIACAGEYGDLRTFSKFAGFGKALQVLYQADAVVAVSRDVERDLLDFGFPPERIERIPNGVDVTFFQRSKPMPTSGNTRFLIIARRHPQKGIDIALQAARILKAQGAAFNIDMYGADYPEYDYPAMARRLGVTDAVKFHPFEKDILSVYHSANSFLLPSRGEGLSNALLEAMAMELPVIATPVSGISDVVEDTVDGILVPPESPQTLAAAMQKIIHDPPLAHMFGQNARRKVVARFSLQSVAQQYSELYARLNRD